MCVNSGTRRTDRTARILELPVAAGTWTAAESATSYRICICGLQRSTFDVRLGLRLGYGQKSMSGPLRLGGCRSVNILLIFESRHRVDDDDDYLSSAGEKPKPRLNPASRSDDDAVVGALKCHSSGDTETLFHLECRRLQL